MPIFSNNKYDDIDDVYKIINNFDSKHNEFSVYHCWTYNNKKNNFKKLIHTYKWHQPNRKWLDKNNSAFIHKKIQILLYIMYSKEIKQNVITGTSISWTKN